MIELTNKHGLEAILEEIQPMRRSRLRNYIVPGLTSYLIGGETTGKVRLFTAERPTRDMMTPHNHRFNFTCLVLSGWVRNTIYRPDGRGEAWCLSSIDQVCGANGIKKYTHTRETTPTFFKRDVTEYKPGDVYSMDDFEIHSIEFSQGTNVLFFEGPQLCNRSNMIEPWCDDMVVPTFKTADWMFLTEGT